MLYRRCCALLFLGLAPALFGSGCTDSAPQAAAASPADATAADALADAASNVDVGDTQDAPEPDAEADPGAKADAADGLVDASAEVAADAEPADSSAATADSADAPADMAADASAPVDVLVGPAESGGVLATGPTGPCVEPANLAPAACLTVKCAAGKVCAGQGECVPATAFWADETAAPDQAWGAVATRPDGAFAVTWSAGNFFNGKQHIWMRTFLQGNEIGSPTLKVSPPGGVPPNLAPSIAAMGDGTWMVMWRQVDQTKDELRYLAQKVTPDGLGLIDAPQQINTTLLGEGASSGGTNIIAPVVMRLRNGRLLMAWSGGVKSGATQLGIYARLLDESGKPMTGELDTGAVLTAGTSHSPAIAALPGGQVLLAWEGMVAGGKGPRVVRGRAFGDNGAPLGPVLTLSPTALPYEALPAVAGYASGQTLALWKAGLDPTSTSAVGVRGRLIGQNLPTLPNLALPAGPPILLADDPEGTYPGAAPAAVLSEFRAMAVWHNMGGTAHNIWSRRHYRSADAWDCQLTEIGGPFLPGEANSRYLPGLASWENGKYVLTFSASMLGMDQTRVAIRLGHW